MLTSNNSYTTKGQREGSGGKGEGNKRKKDRRRKEGKEKKDIEITLERDVERRETPSLPPFVPSNY